MKSGVKFRTGIWQKLHCSKTKHGKRIDIAKSPEMPNIKYSSSWILLQTSCDRPNSVPGIALGILTNVKIMALGLMLSQCFLGYIQMSRSNKWRKTLNKNPDE